MRVLSFLLILVRVAPMEQVIFRLSFFGYKQVAPMEQILNYYCYLFQNLIPQFVSTKQLLYSKSLGIFS